MSSGSLKNVLVGENPPGWNFFLFAGLFLLHAALVSSFIGWYDTGEMTAATLCLGISHPPGQVLYHLLGKIFLLLPLGTPAYRLGLMSAACSSLASVLFWTLACRLAGRRVISEGADRPLSTAFKWRLLLLTLAWSLSLPWWRYSLMPLVYALHLLLFLAVLWVLTLSIPFKWQLAFLVLGAASIFRPTQFFGVPFVALAYWFEKKREERLSPRNILFLLVCFIFGRSTALYLPLRSAMHPALGAWDLTRFSDFARHVLALRFSRYAGAHGWAEVLEVLRQAALHFWTDLTPVGLGLAFLGVYLSVGRWKKVPVFLWVGLGWSLMEASFVLAIPFPTFESHQVLLLWVLTGFFAVVSLCRLEEGWGATPRGMKNSRPVLTTLVLLALVVAQFASIPHFISRRGERGAQDYAKNVLEVMEANSLYVPSEENEFFPVAAYQQSFHLRPNVEIIEPGQDPSRVGPQIRRCLLQGRPLYVTRKWEGLPPGFHFQSVGPLLKVTREPTMRLVERPKGVQPLVSWEGLELMGVGISPPQVRPGERVEITYRWARGKKVGDGTAGDVVALFADEKGNYWKKDDLFWLHDIHELPLSPSAMKPNWEYVERRILFLPPDFPPGDYRLVVGLQKNNQNTREGRESFTGEFYERGDIQTLGKFLGRGENSAVVQFSAAPSGLSGEGLLPVRETTGTLLDPRFVSAAILRITPAR